VSIRACNKPKILLDTPATGAGVSSPEPRTVTKAISRRPTCADYMVVGDLFITIGLHDGSALFQAMEVKGGAGRSRSLKR
jgi:hypothetical protein